MAEIEWLAEQPGIRGIMVPTMWHDLLPYNHPDYDPVWAACQEVGFPVHTHSGEAPQEEYNDNVGIYLAEVCGGRPGPCGTCSSPAPSNGSRA